MIKISTTINNSYKTQKIQIYSSFKKSSVIKKRDYKFTMLKNITQLKNNNYL